MAPGDLPNVCPGAQRRTPQAKDCAPKVNRMHFLVFPGPGQGVLDELAELRTDGHCHESAGDHRLSVANGDDLFAFQGKEQEADHCAAWPPRVHATPRGQFALELLVNGSQSPLRLQLINPESRKALERRRSITIRSIL